MECPLQCTGGHNKYFTMQKICLELKLTNTNDHKWTGLESVTTYSGRDGRKAPTHDRRNRRRQWWWRVMWNAHNYWTSDHWTWRTQRRVTVVKTWSQWYIPLRQSPNNSTFIIITMILIVTSDQSNWTQGRMAATHGGFNRIHANVRPSNTRFLAPIQ